MNIRSVDSDIVDAHAQRSAVLRWALHDWPYVLMLLLAVGGVTVTDHPAVSYWVFMVPVFGAICVAEGWRHFAAREERMRLVYTQALHWAAVLLAMFLIELPAARAVISDNASGDNASGDNASGDNASGDNASGLALLILLALGTFVAGLTARVWRISVVGAFPGISVPAIAWLDQAALFLTLGALSLAVAGGAVWWLRRR